MDTEEGEIGVGDGVDVAFDDVFFSGLWERRWLSFEGLDDSEPDPIK